jgi:2-dehydro-3-deoxygluconokinase
MSVASPRIAAIGECMIELSDLGDGRMTLAYGGDSLNTSVYLARLGAAVEYVTALGDDPYSDDMLAFWRREGVGTRHVRRLAGCLPGLYTIRTDAAGERSFHYWRSASAARELLRDEGGVLSDALLAYRVLFLTGVTLSILDPESRDKLFAIVAAARANGARIVFDSNYRPRGWPGPETARTAFERMARLTDIALPSLDDEAALFGAREAAEVAERYFAWGAAEVAVKAGAADCYWRLGGDAGVVAAETVADVVDTTAAGDAFDAAYLAARLAGLEPAAAVRRGHRLAAAVIRHRGAVIPMAAMPALED